MNQSHASSQAAPNDHQIGSFNINEHQCLLVTEALLTARKMRNAGDGSTEDTVRAIILIQGADYLSTMDEYPDAENDEDFDRQEQAYMSGVSELQDRFPLVCRQHRDANPISVN